MNLSDFGHKMNGANNIQSMFDEMTSVAGRKKVVAMFGGGNPALIPGVVDVYAERMRRLFSSSESAGEAVGRYDNPRGNAEFLEAFVAFMNRHYHLGISEENVVVTTGSQSGYFILFNILAGKAGRLHKQILFPSIPEYIGYFDQGIEPELFASARPAVVKLGDHGFVYRVNFDSLRIDESIAAMCLSRPTNPTGNVLTDAQLRQLSDLAAEHNIPLLIDNAYGLPFPNILTMGTKLEWDGHNVLSFSLSKIGLPGLRVGIFVGPADLMKVVSKANGAICESAPGVGQRLVKSMLEDDSIVDVSNKLIRPYYLERAAKAQKLIARHFPPNLPWRLHTHHGGFFFWLWLEGAKMTSRQIHNYLLEREVIVVPGDHFFIGHDAKYWPHTQECLRINFARPDKELEAGIPILAEAITRAYE
jgi:valine--pyruvate aminotransferase